MKDKEKGKAHPFAGHLNPTEEVLWISTPRQPGTARQQVLAMGAILVSVVMLFLIGVVPSKLPLAEKFAVVVAVSVSAGVVIFVVFTVMWVFRWLMGSSQPERAYAVTNERLLYRNEKNVSSIALEDVPPMSLTLNDDNKDMLSVWALLPMWLDANDTGYVKHLIDEAQKKRMQKLQRL